METVIRMKRPTSEQEPLVASPHLQERIQCWCRSDSWQWWEPLPVKSWMNERTSCALSSGRRKAGWHQVWSLMISVLLLLWTLAACRRLWRGRYVDPDSFSVFVRVDFFLFFSRDQRGVYTGEWFRLLLDLREKRLSCKSLRQCAQVPAWRIQKCYVMVWLLMSASSLSCMNVSCQGRREIKMVLCISCWVAAVALPAFPSCFLFFFLCLVWGSL